VSLPQWFGGGARQSDALGVAKTPLETPLAQEK
jgi:hypothetical protein